MARTPKYVRLAVHQATTLAALREERPGDRPNAAPDRPLITLRWTPLARGADRSHVPSRAGCSILTCTTGEADQ